MMYFAASAAFAYLGGAYLASALLVRFVPRCYTSRQIRKNLVLFMVMPLLLVVDGDQWDIDLPDLQTRMRASLQLEIGPPDDAMATDLILSHAAQRGLALGDGAPAYLVPRMERSHAAIERVVAEIDRLSLERKVPATLSVWRDALEAVQGPEQGRLL